MASQQGTMDPVATAAAATVAETIMVVVIIVVVDHCKNAHPHGGDDEGILVSVLVVVGGLGRGKDDKTKITQKVVQFGLPSLSSALIFSS